MSAAHAVARHAAQQQRDVVAGLGGLHRPAEGLQSGDDRLERLAVAAQDGDAVAEAYAAALDGAGDDGPAAGDGEHVLHGQQERRPGVPHRRRHVGVHRVQQGLDRPGPPGVALQRPEPGDPYDGRAVTAVAVRGEQFTDLQLDQVGQLGVPRVGLVEGDHDVVDADLAGEEHVLCGLWHDPVERGDDEDRAVELRRSGDHVLDVVRVTGHVDVGVVAGVGLVLDVREVDGDAPAGLLGGPVDAVEGHEGGAAALGEDLGDGGGEGGLAVVDVTHGADVEVRLGPHEGRLGHDLFPLLEAWTGPLNRADPPPAGSAGRSGKGQLRAPSNAAKAGASANSAAFGASATADGAAGKAYRDMSPILPDRPASVE